MVSLVVGGVCASQAEEVPTGKSRQWTFDADSVHRAPAGFSFGKTGQGQAGHWVVQAESNAPSTPHVLAQLDPDDTDYRFPLAIADEPVLRDVRVAVRCKPVSGKVDQACGIVFRYQDDQNYYITRANPLEDNIRLYRVVNGSRQQFAGWNGPVRTGVWHELIAEARGDHFTVYWNGQEVIQADDQTFPSAGKVGLWTKADSIIYFDNLRVEWLE